MLTLTPGPMRLFNRSLLLSLALVGASSIAAAQDRPIAGKWQFEITPAPGVRPRSTTGTLDIVLKADSVIGTLEWAKAEGAPDRPPIRLVGRWIGTDVQFTQTSEGTVNANGQTGSISTTTTWLLHAVDDELTGTVRFEISGLSVEVPAVPVKAKRIARTTP